MSDLAVNFEMFLINRGALDGYTLGQWIKYLHTCSQGEFREVEACIRSMNIVRHYDEKRYEWRPNLYTVFLAYLYPEEWNLWATTKHLLGEAL